MRTGNSFRAEEMGVAAFTAMLRPQDQLSDIACKLELWKIVHRMLATCAL